MKIHELKKKNCSKTRKRVGRGISAGGGMTAGRGTKGQRSRSGFNLPRKFEGGQTPLIMRLHKMPGFKSHQADACEVSLETISKRYKNGEVVSMQSLIERGIIKKGDRAKILNSGELKVKIRIEGVPASKSVLKLVEKNQFVSTNSGKKPINKK